MSAPPCPYLVGFLPPPIHGLSMQFQLLVQGLVGHGEAVECLSLPVDVGREVPTWSAYVSKTLRFSWACVSPRRTIYLTIGQTTSGALRDALFINIAALARHRVVCHLHGGNYDQFFDSSSALMKRVIVRALRKIDTMIILSENLRAMFSFMPELNGRIRVVPNGVPAAEYPAVAPKCLPPRQGGPVRVLFLSNLIESKGYLEVVDALALLKPHINIQADFAGLFMKSADDKRVDSEAHAQQLFVDRVAEYGLTSCVRYHGAVSGAIKQQLLLDAHFVVLPSKYYNEGQPVALIEALACGSVLLATNFRAISDMIIEGVTGCYVENGNPRSIADAIMRLIEDPDGYTSMSASARDLFEKKFTYESVLGNLKSILIPTK